MSEEKLEATIENQPVSRVFFKYLIPTTIGMLLMAINIVADGIMVGQRLGATALAGVGIATPVYTLFVATSLWIGVGAATKYSEAMGAKKPAQARVIFTYAITSIFLITVCVSVLAFIFRTELALLLGANEETLPYVTDYLFVFLLFGFVFTIENAFSILVRNDGAPNLAMASLIVAALVNIGLNYWFLFILDWGITGAAVATVIGGVVGFLILSIHFFTKNNNLKLVKFTFNRKFFMLILLIGFPSFLAELGLSVFTIAHNLVFEYLVGTAGVAAFAILNYVHSIMLLLFMGIGSSIQPLVSYYNGAKSQEKIRQTVKLGIYTGGVLGILFVLIGQVGAYSIIRLFGEFPKEVVDLAIPGIRLFFIGYLFMGTNFVMMTYYQSIGQIKMATWITAAREIVFFLFFLALFASFFGVTGTWLAIPAAEFVTVLTIIYYQWKWKDL